MFPGMPSARFFRDRRRGRRVEPPVKALSIADDLQQIHREFSANFPIVSHKISSPTAHDWGELRSDIGESAYLEVRGAHMLALSRALAAKLRTDQSGATSIEYAMIAAGIAVAIVSAVQTLGIKVSALYTLVQNGFNWSPHCIARRYYAPPMTRLLDRFARIGYERQLILGRARAMK
jgi:pilus assembly protein Flp/PilA